MHDLVEEGLQRLLEWVEARRYDRPALGVGEDAEIRKHAGGRPPLLLLLLLEHPLIRRRTMSTFWLAQSKASVAPTISSAATPGPGDVVVRLEQAGEPLGVVLLRQ
jgi:hypothetical protein